MVSNWCSYEGESHMRALRRESPEKSAREGRAVGLSRRAEPSGWAVGLGQGAEGAGRRALIWARVGVGVGSRVGGGLAYDELTRAFFAVTLHSPARPQGSAQLTMCSPIKACLCRGPSGLKGYVGEVGGRFGGRARVHGCPGARGCPGLPWCPGVPRGARGCPIPQ